MSCVFSKVMVLVPKEPVYKIWTLKWNYSITELSNDLNFRTLIGNESKNNNIKFWNDIELFISVTNLLKQKYL